MQEWQLSSIWPYSCYGPVGGKPCVPGFEDLSYEEYRYNWLINGGNLPPQIPLQFQQTFQLRQNYQNYTQENRNVIEKIATAPVTGAAVTSPAAGSIFGGGATATAATTPAASIFGGGATSGSGSIFGGSSVFGAQSQQQPKPTGSIFGGSASFGGSGTVGGTGGIFGGTQQQPQQQQQSVFGQQQQQQLSQPGLFQQPQQQMVPPQQQQSIFAQPQLAQQPPQPGGGIFQQQPPPVQLPQAQPSLFGGVPAGGSIFGGGSTFGQGQTTTATATPSIFGGPTGNSIMGGGTTTAGGGLGGGGDAPSILQAHLTAPQLQQQMVQQRGVYSLESELTPEELEAFQADHFTLENLPTKPPPQSLCL